MDWRREFPQLDEVTYLNNCAHGLLSRRVRAAVEGWLDVWGTNPDWGRWVAEVEEARAAFARLIGADLAEVSVQSSTSAGVSAILSGLRPEGDRREIVTTAIDFPVQPLLASRATRRGFHHLHLPWGDGTLTPDGIDKHLSEETALLMIPAVASFNGYRLDVPEIIERAHAKGVPVMVDAFQALGTLPVDVHAWGADFLVTGVYKWLLGTSGFGFAYAAREWHERLAPTTLGWYAQEDPYAFDPLGPLAEDARRLQGGGASVVGANAARAGLEIIAEADPARIEAHNHALGDRLIDAATERGWEVLTPAERDARGSIVTFRVPRLRESLAALEKERVVVNERLDGLRVSPHFYNGPEDVDQLFAVLDAVNR